MEQSQPVNNEKKLYGDNRIHRTRNINSCKADYNLSLHFFWPKTTIQKEDASGSLGCNQYRCRKIGDQMTPPSSTR